MTEEIWRDVSGYEGLYQASNFGRVKSLEHYSKPNWNGAIMFIPEKILCSCNNKQGYKIVSLCGKQYLLHRLIAKSFPDICGEWFENCVVHHINHNPEDNKAENLRVFSREEHSNYHRESSITIVKHSKMVYQYDYNWNYLRCFNNSTEAALFINGDVESIRKSCSNNHNSHYYKGYRWLYAD